MKIVRLEMLFDYRKNSIIRTVGTTIDSDNQDSIVIFI